MAQDGLLADAVALTYHGGLGCGFGRRAVGEVEEEQGAAIGGDGFLAVEEPDDPACGAVVAEQDGACQPILCVGRQGDGWPLLVIPTAK
ncbi:hypothetical protein CG719_31660 [Streptomyces sp. CB01373]|nr:hypothetical protein CG719_31660 [Streptomyces sp. CB01373]